MRNMLHTKVFKLNGNEHSLYWKFQRDNSFYKSFLIRIDILKSSFSLSVAMPKPKNIPISTKCSRLTNIGLVKVNVFPFHFGYYVKDISNKQQEVG